MLVSTAPTQATVIKAGSFEVTDMSIRSEAGISMAISFLSDRLYTDKIGAVVRETICNALDEHKKFNVARPIEVTVTDTEIIFRDFAAGLSKDAAQNIFGNFFESTKNKSNDFIGGFGIGAKSPFAYTDVWYVTSYFEGTQYNFMCSKERDNGITKTRMTLINSLPTEETGVQIRVPIKYGDKSRFAQSVYEFARNLSEGILINDKPSEPRSTEFDITYDIDGQPVTVTRRLDSYASFRSEEELRSHYRYGNTGYSASWIKIQVAAPIYKMETRLVSEAKPEFATLLKDNHHFRWFLEMHNFVLPIGSVTIAPSRESVEADRSTINNINHIILACYEKYMNKINTDIDAVTTAEEARECIRVHGIYFVKQRMVKLGEKFAYLSYDRRTDRHVNYTLQDKEVCHVPTLINLEPMTKIVFFDDTPVEGTLCHNLPERIHGDILHRLGGSNAKFVGKNAAAGNPAFCNPFFLASIRSTCHFEETMAKIAEEKEAAIAAARASGVTNRTQGTRRKGLVTFLRLSKFDDKKLIEERTECASLSEDVTLIDEESIPENLRCEIVKEAGSFDEYLVIRRAPKAVALTTWSDFVKGFIDKNLEYHRAYELIGKLPYWNTILFKYIVKVDSRTQELYERLEDITAEKNNMYHRLMGGIQFRNMVVALFPEEVTEDHKTIKHIDEIYYKNQTNEVVSRAMDVKEYRSGNTTYQLIEAILEKNPNFLEDLITANFIK